MLENVELVRVILISLYLLQTLVEVVALNSGSIWHIACQLSSRERFMAVFSPN